MQLGHLTAGSYSQIEKAICWDDQTETGEPVSSGTYFYQLHAGDYTDGNQKDGNPEVSPNPYCDYNQPCHEVSGLSNGQGFKLKVGFQSCQ